MDLKGLPDPFPELGKGGLVYYCSVVETHPYALEENTPACPFAIKTLHLPELNM